METTDFLQTFLPQLRHLFGERICFCGLQGSRSRGEHSPDSDADMVVILDALSAADIAAYRSMMRSLPAPQLACGFLGGREELEAWEPADLVSLCLDTVPLIGDLGCVMELADPRAARQAAWLGACSVYHGCVHNMIYSRRMDALQALLKNATFVLKAWWFARSGVYPRTLAELRETATSSEKQLLALYSDCRAGVSMDFDAASALVFAWAQTAIMQLSGNSAADCRDSNK